MKKDLQERAVSNEREYFEDRVSKHKIDLSPVIQWIKPVLQDDASHNHFKAFSNGISRLLPNTNI